MSSLQPGDPFVSADVTEQILPGIGCRYECHAVDGGDVIVIVHHSGRRDLYVSHPGSSLPASAITLTDVQARTLGAVLGGAYFKPTLVEEVEAVIGGLLIDWVTLREDSPGVGHTIAELEIRLRTRMTIAAVVRKRGSVIALEPTELLEAGDRLVVVGSPHHLRGFVQLVVG